jgi:hypothetical protein
MADSLPCINLTVNLNVSLVATPENMESLKKKESKSTSVEISALFAWLISHQPTVLFSQNKPATSNQPAVLFSQNKPAISHQPTEQAAD